MEKENEKLSNETYYKEQMWYYHDVLGIAHGHLTRIGLIFRNEDLTQEEKCEAIIKHVSDYKSERTNYHDKWALKFLPSESNTMKIELKENEFELLVRLLKHAELARTNVNSTCFLEHDEKLFSNIERKEIMKEVGYNEQQMEENESPLRYCDYATYMLKKIEKEQKK